MWILRFALRRAREGLTTSLALAVLLTGCASPPPSAPRAPIAEAPTLEPPYELVINGIVDSALDDLSLQMRRLPAFASALVSSGRSPVALDKKEASAAPPIVIAVDRSVGKSGQPSNASDLLDSLLLQTARQKWPPFEVVEASPPVLGRAQYILAGKLSALDTVSSSRGNFRADFVLTELKTSHIVAQVTVRFSAQGVDLNPLWCCITH